MKRALFVTTHPALGGAQKWTYDQITILKNEYEIYFATGSEGWLSQKASPLCKEVFIDKKLYSFSSIIYLFKLYKFVRSNQIDIIIASSANAGIYTRLLKVLIPSLSVVYVSHGWSSIYRGNRIYQTVERLLSYLSTAILVVSKDDYIKAIDILEIYPKKLTLIENAIFPYNEDGSVPECSADMHNIHVVMIARFEYPKRQDLLMEAAKELPYMHFNFIGEGAGLNEAKKYNLPNTTFFGAISDVETILKKSDLFMLLSGSEGMPLAVLEALACAKPMILSDIPSMVGFINDNGLLVKNDVNSVVMALKKIQKMNFESMGINSQKLFNKRFNLNNKKNDYLSFYESLS